VKLHKPCCDEEFSKLVDQRLQSKLECLQDTSEVNENNMSNVRREDSRHFGNKEREYLKDKIYELVLNSNYKNIRGLYRKVNEFKTGYQSRTNLVKDKRGDLHEDPHKIVNT
jgi:hypothetical protein